MRTQESEKHREYLKFEENTDRILSSTSYLF